MADIVKRDKRGIKRVYWDTVYGAPMPIDCCECGKHMTEGQYNAGPHDEESGRYFCGQNCAGAWWLSEAKPKFRHRPPPVSECFNAEGDYHNDFSNDPGLDRWGNAK